MTSLKKFYRRPEQTYLIRKKVKEVKQKTITFMIGIMFMSMFVVLPVGAAFLVEFLSNIITMDFIVKIFYIFLVCDIIFVFKIEKRLQNS